ncbi:MAG: alpha/beta fold hydrolase [bacterium]
MSAPVPPSPRLHRIPTRVGSIAVTDEGEGIPVLLWPSLFSDHRLFRHAVPLLRERWRVLCVDGPGFGQSDPPRGDVPAEVYAQVVVELLDALGIERAFIAGCSWGGQIAVHVGVQAPERVLGVLTMNSPFGPSKGGHLFEVLGTRLLGSTRLWGEGVARTMFSRASREAHPDRVREFASAFTSFDNKSAATTVRTVLTRSDGLGEALPRLKVPATFLLGAEDKLYPVKQLRPFAELAPRGKVGVVASVGHLTPLEDPSALRDELKDLEERYRALLATAALRRRTEKHERRTSFQTHVVFGAGQVGRLLVDHLLSRGYRVRSVQRSEQRQHHPSLEVVRADVLDKAAALRAAAGATVVYHCAGAPYAQWSSVLPTMYRNIAAAAMATRARLVVLDNVYAVGATGTFDEDTPERPCSRKGALRKQLVDEYRDMHAKGELAVAIGRASDFIGPGANNTMLLHPRSIRQLLSGRKVDVIGDIDQPHSWSYTPDVARGLMELGLHPQLDGLTLHLPVLAPRSVRFMLNALATALKLPLRVRRMPGWMLAAVSTFDPTMGELHEMRYQFENPFVMSDTRIRQLLPLRPTHLSKQVITTAAWLERQRPR